MFDSIFDNIFVLIPIAVIIGIRILSVWQKRQAEASKLRAPPTNAAAYDDTDDGGAYFEPPEDKPPVPKASQPAAVVPAAAAYSTAAKPARKTAEAPKAAAGPGPAFPRNLEFLPPLKRAMVLSEILGPPKGF
jgi:hypothetical protein